MTKQAMNQIRMESFNDELIKIAAESYLGTEVDWNNLTPEQIEKLAR